MMSVPDGYTNLGSGKIASVVTYLEMQRPPDTVAVAARPGWSLESCSQPDVQWYRSLFLAVGKEWLWFSRLQMTDEALRSVIHNPAVEIFCLKIDREEKGILELDRREMPDIEIAFIGLVSEAIGHGAGKFLLDQAVRLAWSRQPRRVTRIQGPSPSPVWRPKLTWAVTKSTARRV